MFRTSFLLSSAVVLVMSAGTARAADVAPLPRDWGGFYAGLHVGGAWGMESSLEANSEVFIENEPLERSVLKTQGDKGSVTCKQQSTGDIKTFNNKTECPNGFDPYTPSGDDDDDDDDDGPSIVDVVSLFDRATSDGDDLNFLAGINAGFNLQHGAFVFGVEGDFSAISEGAEELDVATVIASDGEVMPQQTRTVSSLTTTAEGEFGLKNVGTLRARFGYDIDGTWLPFVTGGLAWGKVSTKGTATYVVDTDKYSDESKILLDGPASVTQNFGDSEYEMGWTLGAGVNYRIADNAFLGLTYLYTDLGEHSFRDRYDDIETGLASTVEGEVDATFHTVRVSFDVLF